MSTLNTKNFMIFNIYSAYTFISNMAIFEKFFFLRVPFYFISTLRSPLVCLRFEKKTFIYLCASKIFMALFISLYLLGFIALRAIVLREMFISVSILLIVSLSLSSPPCNAQFFKMYFKQQKSQISLTWKSAIFLHI